MSDSNLNPQPLPPQQQPQYQQGYGAPAQSRWNVLAIVAFIAAFFVSIVGIILGFIALSQIKRTGEQGRGLALAAVIIGFAAFALGIIFSIIIFAAIAANPNVYYQGS
jgi:peptidyl-prolyl cis-trans isomerase B (cyclophilin B)